MAFYDKARHAEQLGQERRFWLRTTYLCNNRCRFCLDGDALHSPLGHLPFDQLSAQISAAAHEGYQRIILSGGEASTHPDFLKLVLQARKAGFAKIQTISNGRTFSQRTFIERARRAGLDEITFSLHGHTPAIHDHLTQVPGAFEQCLSGIRHALELGFIVSVDSTLTSLNIDYLQEFLQWAMQLGVYEFDLLHMIPFGRAFEEDYQALRIEPTRYKRELARALSPAYHPRPHIWTSRIPLALLEGIEMYCEDPHKLLDELNGRRDFFADYLLQGTPPPCLDDRRCTDCALEGFCAFTLPLLDAWRRKEAHTVELFPAPRDEVYAHCSKAIAGWETCPQIVLRCDYPRSKAAGLSHADMPWLEEEIQRWGALTSQLTIILPASFPLTIPIVACQGTLIYVGRPATDNYTDAVTQAIGWQIEYHEALSAEWAQDSYDEADQPDAFHLPPLEQLADYERAFGNLDLVDLLEKVPAVPLLGIPPCLHPQGTPQPQRVTQALFSTDGTFDHESFARYYLAYHNSGKSLECPRCMHHNNCRGLHVNVLRRQGVALLNPGKAG